MIRLPVIVGFGGVGPAGRSSFHHAYDRIIWESLDRRRRRTTVTALSSMMNLAFERDGELRAPDDASGVPSRPKGIESRIVSYIGVLTFLIVCHIPPGNSIEPGATQLTRTPFGASSAAVVFEYEIKAALTAA